MKLWASITPVEIGSLVRVGRELEEAGVDGIHVDMRDGVFVPGLGFGPGVIRALSSRYSIPVEAHLMTERPELHMNEVADAGASRVSFHLEATRYPYRVATVARQLGLSPGIAINPTSSPRDLGYLLDIVEFVNVLTTEPDEAGEELLPRMAERVAAVVREVPQDFPIEVDGGISMQDVPGFVRAGATEFVIGRRLVGDGSIADNVAAFRECLASESA